jgi:membrane-associated phospholipid phosphatase
MKHNFIILFICSLFTGIQLPAQVEPGAGSWKTWFITSGKEHRLAKPSSYKEEIKEIIARQQSLDAAGRAQMQYWNAGAPGYRWQNMVAGLWQNDTGRYGILGYLVLSVATYDATIAAWDTKYAYKTIRPFKADDRIRLLVPDPASPSYPCEHSVAAGVAVTVISHFFPSLADSAKRVAQRIMDARIVAGVAFPSDTRAGFELGKSIAEKGIAHTKDYVSKAVWDGKLPPQPGIWRGRFAMGVMIKHNKTFVLQNSSELRPPPPPDFAKEMDELRKFKPTFRSQANAFYYASPFVADDPLSRKIMEYNLHLNPPRAARIYALSSIAIYDGVIACFDAKYAYWGIRPDQYDTTYKPLIPTPPFPGYPSGHAMSGGILETLYSYFFPPDKAYFQKRAKDGAESRFHGGIHFRTDNEAGLELGRKVAAKVMERAEKDGSQ